MLKIPPHDQKQPVGNMTTPTLDTPESPNALGGFAQSLRLLEFNQIRQHLASHTRTVLGREAALSLTAIRDLLEIASRQQETTEARQFLEQGGSLESGPDIDLQERVHRALLGGILRGAELQAIQQVLRAANSNSAALARHDELPLLSRTAEAIPDLRGLERAIRLAISPSGEILDDASPELRRLRQEGRASYQRLNEVMERSLRRWQRQGAVQEPLVTERNGRLVLLVKAEMRSRVPGIIHDVSDSGATVFIEPMPAIQLGNQWREIRLAEEREEERILRHFSAQVGQAGQDLLVTLDLLARLDLALAKGRYSMDQRATAPWVADGEGENRFLQLTGARHPLLTGTVVPIGMELGGENRVMLITGPNAGGKTVTLKTVGLLALMAHAGLHVPAEAAHFPLLDGIYADIGDQQSIQQSLSTFSSHLQNLCSIMTQATVKSLVLVDELGTSTDPEEGSALAEGILHYFQSRGVLLVATTHHRDVARYVQGQPGMINASLDLHPQTLEPTYRVTLGVPGRSYALTIAARLGLAPEIIEQARSRLPPAEQAAENLLRDLQEERRLVDQLRQEAEATLARARQQQAEMEVRLASVETAKIELVETARQELQNRIGDLLARLQEAERALRQAQDTALAQPAARSPFQEHRERLEEARRQVTSPHWQPIEFQGPTWQREVQEGDRVFIRGIPRPVEVITPPNAEGQVEVLLGTMRAKVPTYQLERPAPTHPPAARQRVYLARRASPTNPSSASGGSGQGGEIDLRGLRVEESLERIEKFLNDATLDNVSPVRIIHGKGTGALRRAIWDYLASHPLVASSAPAEAPSGDGVTVVELK